MERVFDDAADHLRREQRQLRGECRGDGVEVGALVFFDAARGADLSEVRAKKCPRELELSLAACKTLAWP